MTKSPIQQPEVHVHVLRLTIQICRVTTKMTNPYRKPKAKNN